MTNKVNSALDFLQEFDSVSWYQEAFGIVLDYIIELEKEKEGWIPVSERLPEKYGEFLCQEAQGFLFVDKWTGKWEIASCNCGEVVAWMSLPKPYKVENEG